MIELEHSPLGGSAAHRFLSCTASFLLQKQLIEAGQFENIESEYAKLGTGAHELGATAILEGREPFEYLGEEFNGYIAGWPDGINLDAVHVYFNECKKILGTRKEQGHLLLETTIHLPHIHPLLKGTVDFGFWSLSDGVYLRDYKNGEGIGVSAPGNRQLLYYGSLMILSVEELQDPQYRNLPVNLGIVQPNFYGVFEEPDVWITTVGEVLDWCNNQLLPRMNYLTDRAVVQMDDYVPGSHCQFCPVLLDCLVMQQAFTEFALASEDFIVMLSNEELDHYYSQREYARRFMNALEETVRARLIGGSNIPSAKLVEKRVHRVWKPGATAALQAAFGEKAYKPKEIKSPAQVEKLSSLGKDMALEWGYKPESNALSVAPLSDPRPEAKPRTNANVFTAHAASYEEQGF